MRDKNKPTAQARLVTDTFDQEAGVYHDGYLGETSMAHSFTVRRRRVYEQLEGINLRSVLDVGCGPGVMRDHIERDDVEYFGVDVSEQMIRQCRDRSGHLASNHFCVGNVEALQFPAAAFDVVVAMGLVEYLQVATSALSEMARVVKPGGIVIVSFPNRSSPYRLWDRHAYRPLAAFAKRLLGRQRQETVVHQEFIERELRPLFEPSQMEVLDIVYYNFKLVLPPLDRFAPGLTVLSSRLLESFARGAFRWLGTGFIVKARRL